MILPREDNTWRKVWRFALICSCCRWWCWGGRRVHVSTPRHTDVETQPHLQRLIISYRESDTISQRAGQRRAGGYRQSSNSACYHSYWAQQPPPALQSASLWLSKVCYCHGDWLRALLRCSNWHWRYVFCRASQSFNASIHSYAKPPPRSHRPTPVISRKRSLSFSGPESKYSSNSSGHRYGVVVLGRPTSSQFELLTRAVLLFYQSVLMRRAAMTAAQAHRQNWNWRLTREYQMIITTTNSLMLGLRRSGSALYRVRSIS